MEPRQGEESYHRESAHAGLDLKLDLIFEEFRMLHHVVIKDIVVREAGEGEIEKEDAEEGDDGKGEKLARDVVAGPCRRSGVETGPDGVEEVVVGDGQDEVHREEGESTAEDDGKLSSPSRQQHFLLQHTKSHQLYYLIKILNTQ